MVPVPLLALQPGVIGTACAALDKDNAIPAAPATEAMNIVALVSAQMPTDTNIPLIFVKR
jgi:hypothetical protein